MGMFTKSKPTVADVNKEGLRVNYTRLKKAIHECEYKGKESEDCKRILKDLGINHYGDD